jgi:hypothetical protein
MFLATPMFSWELELEVMQFGQLVGWLGTFGFFAFKTKAANKQASKS